MPRVLLDRLELAQKLFLTITRAFSRHSSLRADLLNPRETEAAERKRGDAARRLADYLAEQLVIAKHEVTREAVSGDSEGILKRLRDGAAQREEAEDGSQPNPQEPHRP
jgi:hypothetical protein